MHTTAFLLINPISFRTVVCIAIHFGMEQNSVIKMFGKQIENDPIIIFIKWHFIITIYSKYLSFIYH